MSTATEIIEASPDLKELFADGFEIAVKHAHLITSSVPYVTASHGVARGVLIMALTLESDVKAGKPPDHVAYFAGSLPHYADGTPISGIINKEAHIELANGIIARFCFSSKPSEPDANYSTKVRRYVDILSGPAKVLDRFATAQTRQIVESLDDDSPLRFPDTNSSRAQINVVTDRLKGWKIAIIGVGGTGSYILDFVAKTPVKEIHLFDADEFSLHNAYRAPGAPTIEMLRSRSTKVAYLTDIYSRMHKGIQPHAARVTPENLQQLAEMNFIFTCMDPGPDKEAIVAFLIERKIPFIDTGLGIERVDDSLVGLVNLITVTPQFNDHLSRVPMKEAGDNDLYQSNVQIAELNALNAVLAVMRWKKIVGFYKDFRHEHECSYTIETNQLLSETIHA